MSAPPGKPPGPPKGSGPIRYLVPGLIATFALGTIYSYTLRKRLPVPETTSASSSTSTTLLKTPGVSNIEKAYSAGGATSTHTPAYGGTPRGKQNDMKLTDESGGKQGFEIRNRDGEISAGEEQRPNQPGFVGRKFNEVKYGSGDQK